MKLAVRQIPSLPADRDAQDSADGLHARGRVCACCREASAAVARARAEVVCVRCGGDASACFYRPARRACPRRRSDGGNYQAQGERGGHPNIQLYSPTPRRACNECGRSELRSGFGGSVKMYRSDSGSCPLSIIPHGAAPTAVTSAGNSAAASAHADGGLCHALSARSNSTATTLRFLPCRLDPSPAVQEIDGLQR